jgi:hypothetical protein
MNSFTHPDNDPLSDPTSRHRQTRPPADLVHPGWCNEHICRAVSGDPHRGAPTMIRGDRIGSAELEVRLWSPSDDLIPQVLVELLARNCDTGRRLRVDLSIRQVRRLRDQLTVVMERARTR